MSYIGKWGVTGGIRCGAYAVGFFDLCGQSNALRPHTGLDAFSDNAESLKNDFAVIACQLHSFRRDIAEFYEGVSSAPLVDSAPADTPPEILEMARSISDQRIQLQGFSDSVVAYVPLAVEPGITSVFAVGHMLVSVASTMLMSLARGTIVRGAIDAGWAMELFDGEIYGPALLSAYELEDGAGWPRVVIGDGLNKLWGILSRYKISQPIDAMNVAVARVQANLIFSDVDGQLAVDYLGKDMLRFIEVEAEDLPDLIDAAHVSVEVMHADKADDEYIEKKLQRTLDYFDSRVGQLTDSRRRNGEKHMQAIRATLRGVARSAEPC